ncbi:MAG: diguanylate cyclase [Desulfohalobiaceae bacterium]|nr:diguanylate cyclase [Desulfohalobiaceae bacterium]
MKEKISLSTFFQRTFLLAMLAIVLFTVLFLFQVRPTGSERRSEAEQPVHLKRNKELVRNKVREAIRITKFTRRNIRYSVQAGMNLEVSRVGDGLDRHAASYAKGEFSLPAAEKWMGKQGQDALGTSVVERMYMFLIDSAGRVVPLPYPSGRKARSPAQQREEQFPFQTPVQGKLLSKALRKVPQSEDVGGLVSGQQIGASGWVAVGFVPQRALRDAVREKVLHLFRGGEASSFLTLCLIDARGKMYSTEPVPGEKDAGEGATPVDATMLRIKKTLQAVEQPSGGFVSSFSSRDIKEQESGFESVFLDTYEPWQWRFVAATHAVRESYQGGILGGKGLPLRAALTVFLGLLSLGAVLFYLFRRMAGRVDQGLWTLRKECEAAASDPECLLGEDAFPFREFSSVAEKANQMLQKRREREEQAEWEKGYFEQLFENAPDGIVLVDASGTVLRVNKEFCTHFLFKEDEVLGRELDALVGGEDKLIEGRELTDKVLRGYRVYSETVRYRKDGQAVPVAVYGVPLTISTGERLIYGQYKDIREKKEAEEKLLQLTETDPLTGIANRMKFEQLLEEEIRLSQRYSTSFSLVMVDIDFFKQINDRYGHLVGDTVLKEISAAMRGIVRDTDALARVGGEEFQFLLRRTEYEEAVRFAERMRREIETTRFSVDEAITCSFGVTSFREDDDLKLLLDRVDDFLYTAKKQGRNRVVGGVKRGIVLGY